MLKKSLIPSQNSRASSEYYYLHQPVSNDPEVRVSPAELPFESILKPKHSAHLFSHKSNFSSKERNTCSISELQSSKKRVFTGIKDPGLKPLCEKSACFEKKLSDLPQSRLKLVLNQKILKLKKNAADRISEVFYIQSLEKLEKEKKLKNFRKKALKSLESQRQKNFDLQAKTGLFTYKSKSKSKIKDCDSSNRLLSLSMPKTVKIENLENYLSRFGLTDKDFMAAEAAHTVRNPNFKGSKEDICSQKFGEIQEEILNMRNKVMSQSEVEASMKEINEFHKRYGELHGRVGFPQIYLEKYKNYSKP